MSFLNDRDDGPVLLLWGSPRPASGKFISLHKSKIVQQLERGAFFFYLLSVMA